MRNQIATTQNPVTLPSGVPDNLAPPTPYDQLRKAGLRPTRQRLALADLLLSGGDRHVTAESLHSEATQKWPELCQKYGRMGTISLATIYNNLHDFTAVGLLKRLTVDTGRIWYDTNIHDHHHFYLPEQEILLDIDPKLIELAKLPTLPDGASLQRIDITIRLAASNPGN
ncbi:MAG: Fur family transcriptional regulator [Alphaproteobacteria bacterium]|nr:Fur family transcriptional regulator [Alphaproteobacteria bacterium]